MARFVCLWDNTSKSYRTNPKRIFSSAIHSRSFALAGRNRERLELIAAEIGVPSAPIIIADVDDQDGLVTMARTAKVVITTVGPYRHYGEAVVRACVEARTDYLDVSGEPEFIERMEFEYGPAARAAGCYVTSAVGFDSVPCDVGAHWTSTLFKPPSRCTMIDTFIFLRGGAAGVKGHFPTYESAVYGLGCAQQLAALRRRALAARGGHLDLGIPGPKPSRRVQSGAAYAYDPAVSAWLVPFMGSDASVVRRTATALAEEGKPAYHCNVYLTLPTRFVLYMFLVFGGIFSFLAKRAWGRKLLLAYPRIFSFGLFSHEGPNEQQLAETSFEMINIARGYSKGALHVHCHVVVV